MNAESDTLPWPTMDQVERQEDIKVQRYWLQHLPACETREQMAIIRRITERIKLLRPRGGPQIKLIPRV